MTQVITDVAMSQGNGCQVRTICIPVAECISHTKSEFYAALRKSLDLAVKIANLSASSCLKQDDLMQDKAPKIYTYPAVKHLCEGVSNQAVAVIRQVEADYRRERWQIKNGKRSIRSYRSAPWPLLNNKSCKSLTVADKGETFEVKIKLLDCFFTVRLAGGSNHRDQIRGIRAAMEGGRIGDSKIWIDRKGKAIIGLSVSLPVVTKERSGEAAVSSGIDFIASLTLPRSSVPFILNGDDIQVWKEESKRRNQRLRQARKQGVSKRKIAEALRDFSHKMARRLRTKTHEMASQIVKKADSRNAKTITIDFTIKSFAPSFPWYDFAQKIKYKAQSLGIEVIEKTQSVTEPDCENPHIYFAYDPNSHRVKIGKTKGGKGRLESYWTSNPDWVLLAVDNHPQNKLTAKEKYYHAMFDSHRVVNRDKIGNELFMADPVIAWLRAADWLGNAGNLSQIMQVLDVSQDATRDGDLNADCECTATQSSAEVFA